MSSPNSPSAMLTPSERALKESLTKLDFRDVHLYAFTRKTVYADGSSSIGHPLPLLAIGSILKDSEHFAKLLTSGFAESHATADPASTDIRQYALADEYDYESDSDLDEFEEAGETPTPGSSSLPVKPEGKGKRKEEEKPDTPVIENKEDHANGRSPQRQILLPSIAYRTLCACIFYLYTGKVNFLPLRSEGMSQRQFAMFTAGDARAPLCSPKSMYRLAESYDIPGLQDLAYDAILARLTPANIVEEAFSRFFARYDRLREHTVSYLSQNYYDSNVQDSLQDALDKVLLGHVPHAGLLLRSLLGLRMATAPPSWGQSPPISSPPPSGIAATPETPAFLPAPPPVPPLPPVVSTTVLPTASGGISGPPLVSGSSFGQAPAFGTLQVPHSCRADVPTNSHLHGPEPSAWESSSSSLAAPVPPTTPPEGESYISGDEDPNLPPGPGRRKGRERRPAQGRRKRP
ncbi:hypothetical protein TRAPUB_11233 [Trametes pubescens]|uniref:BTB domain-containing protein n=1 Tax=Trametes pubescens TaxID=154538 RepID=A0A1M2VXC4_TRAPU|nr:hypothetical protein TRAPUB_11233 [Trametes pubescens]